MSSTRRTLKLFELGGLQTDILIQVMNKMKAKDFIRLRRACTGMNTFAERYQDLIEARSDRQRLRFEQNQGTILAYVNGRGGYSWAEWAYRFSGVSFATLLFLLDFETVDKSPADKRFLMEVVTRRVWRQTHLELNDIWPEILDCVRPSSLSTTIPKKALEDETYVRWFNKIISVAGIERLVYKIGGEDTQMKVLELILQKWCDNELGSVLWIDPGIKYLCAHEIPLNLKRIETGMGGIFEILDKLPDVEKSHGGYEVYEEDPKRPTKKPVGIIKIYLKREGREDGCLVAFATTGLSGHSFTMSFCFFTKECALVEWMKDRLGDTP